jgi:predicted  nucleic acid-binding Zn-ribbon protein
VEQGVYEIDVEKLLEDNPIVIQKDGSYLIHLPSIFKEGREKSLKKDL